MIDKLNKNDWNHMHDCILNSTCETTEIKSTREELIDIFNKLPEDLKQEAYEWGMNDTVWRERILLSGIRKIIYNYESIIP